ncbi:MAG: hypothetical protein AAGP08_00085 [Pseudomonadota bacterium]
MSEKSPERLALEAEAKDLGVKFAWNTGDETLAERIAEAKDAAPSPDAPTVTQDAPPESSGGGGGDDDAPPPDAPRQSADGTNAPSSIDAADGNSSPGSKPGQGAPKAIDDPVEDRSTKAPPDTADLVETEALTAIDYDRSPYGIGDPIILRRDDYNTLLACGAVADVTAEQATD